MRNSLDGHAMARRWGLRERISARKKKKRQRQRSKELVNSKSKRISP
jgi:hypothetical protein